MKRTISAMVGKGSVNHNSRKFNAKNTDPERTHLNISFCNENIKTVYHELFDEAQKRFNEKQTRSDRCIEDYYEKIRNGKQEKPFHEIILQIGNCEDTGTETEVGEKATEVLKEYYSGFQERNPHLRVFSAHLHLDEHTPHIHIDFVPFTTGSKRGLDTRVSLKQALLQQGFKGDGKRDNEWNRWVLSEKKILAAVMERYGFEWDQKGTHEEHLSDYDYKKKMRAEEVEKLTEQVENLKEKIADKEGDFKEMKERIMNFDSGKKKFSDLKNELDNSDEYALPEPQGLMTAKSYKSKIVEPLIRKLKKLVLTVFESYIEMADRYHQVNNDIDKFYRHNQSLRSDIEYLAENNNELREENKKLRSENKDYAFLKKMLGQERMDSLVKEANDLKNQKYLKRNHRNQSYER